MATLPAAQALGLVQDLDVAEGFIEHGLDQIGRIDGGNDLFQLPMHLLANGFERFLKLTLAIAELESTGSLPDAEQLRRRFGHDLTKLNDAIAARANRVAAYTARPAAQDDLAFLRTDALLRDILSALTLYAKQGRYHNMATFLGGQSAGDADEAWQGIEASVLKASPEWAARLGDPAFTGYYAELAKTLTASIQRYARAISRMWTLGPLGDLGRRHMPSQFLMLSDDELPQLRRRRTS